MSAVAEIQLGRQNQIASLDDAWARIKEKGKCAGMSGWHCGQKNIPDGNDSYWDRAGVSFRAITEFKTGRVLMILASVNILAGFSSDTELVIDCAQNTRRAQEWLAQVAKRVQP